MPDRSHEDLRAGDRGDAAGFGPPPQVGGAACDRIAYLVPRARIAVGSSFPRASANITA